MSFESILSDVKSRATNASTLGAKLKFDFGDQKIFLDGSGSENVVSTADDDADCTITISLKDFEALLNGELNPMMAFMMGKVKVKGDMGIAMKLQSLVR